MEGPPDSRKSTELTRRFPLPVLLRLQRRSLAVSAVYFYATSTALISLALTLPTAQYYQGADYATTHFDYQVDGFITKEDFSAFEALSAPRGVEVLLSFPGTQLSHGGRLGGVVNLYYTEYPERLDLSWFASNDVIQSAATASSWVDLSAAAARDLGVGPGDTLSATLFGGSIREVAQVRRILAVNHRQPAAVGPMPTAVRMRLPSDVLGTVAFLQSDRQIDEIQAVDRKLSVHTRGSLLEASSSGFRIDNLAVALVASALGVGGVMALALREAAFVVRRRAADLAVIAAIGASARQLALGIVSLEGIGAFMASTGVWLTIYFYLYRFVFAPALPPSFGLPLAIALLAGTLCYVAMIGVLILRRASREMLLMELMESG